MNRRDFLKITGISAAALGLAACGGSSSSTAAPASSGAAAPAAQLPKNIEVQLPASAGGGTDVAARTLTGYINSTGKTNMTIINNTDGGGVVAYETARTAKADGSKILFFHTTMCIKTATGVYQYSAAEDFKIIGVSQNIEKGGYVLVVPADAGIATLKDFVAKAEAEELMIGVETGGSSHLMAGMLAGELGVGLKYVEAGPDTEKLTALVGGSINCALVNANQAKQYIEAGKIVALGCFSTSSEGGRNSVLPDVPSFIEQGYNLIYATNFYVLANPEMSDELAKEILALFTDAAADPDTAAILNKSGFGMTFLPYEDGPAVLKDQQESLTVVCEELGLKK